jgi:hypothetical protein
MTIIGGISARDIQSLPTKADSVGPRSATGLRAGPTDASTATPSPSYVLYVTSKNQKGMGKEDILSEDSFLQIEKHSAGPTRAANTAFETMREEVISLNRVAAMLRPDIKPTDWDFSYEDGKLVVKGNVSKDQAQWLELQLNSNEKMVTAAKTFVQAAVDHLETSETNPPARVGYGSQLYYRDFENVAAQLADKLSFKTMVHTIVESSKDPFTGKYKDSPFLGGDALAWLGSQLTSARRD